MGDKGDEQSPITAADDIAPKVRVEEIPELAWRLYGIKVRDVKKLPGFYDLNVFFRADADTIDNQHITTASQAGYVFKVLNAFQSSDPACIDALTAMMKHTLEKGIMTQAVVRNRNGEEYSWENFQDGDRYAVRLVTFVPGTVFHDTPYIAGSFRNVGRFLGQFHNAIEDFHHSFYDTYAPPWTLTETPKLRDYIDAVKDEHIKAVIDDVFTGFETSIRPILDKCRKGIIHHDFNEHNLIMQKVPALAGQPDTGVHDVAAILDFGDSSRAYCVDDVAICITHMSLECPDEGQLEAGGHVIAGYLEHRTLNETEMDCLKTLVCVRICQMLMYGAYEQAQHPENEYLKVIMSVRCWPTLQRFWNMDKEKLYSIWNRVRRST